MLDRPRFPGLQGKMFKRPHYIALILVVLFVAVLSRLPSQTLGNLKLAIGGTFLPLFGLAGSSHQVADQAGKVVLPRHVLIEQNEQYRQTNQALTIRLQQYDEVWRENERLRKMIGWQRQNHWNLKLARILTRDPANWWRSVQIDLGSQDGVLTNLPVITCDGLVGRITTVGATRSQVILLGDPNLRVGALNPATRETGIIQSTSTSPQENNMIDLGFLPGNSQARPGHVVVTSGPENGSLFPIGIPIGTIVDIHPKDYGLSTEARVKLSANMSALEEVWVILP